MKDICSKCGENKEIVAIGLALNPSDGVIQYCKECAEEEGYIKPYPQEETKKRKE